MKYDYGYHPFSDEHISNINMGKILDTYYYTLDNEVKLLAALIKEYCHVIEDIYDALNSQHATKLQKKDMLLALKNKTDQISSIFASINMINYKISAQHYGK